MADAVSTDVIADSDVKYSALENSPSVITLLNDKLDSQSKVNFFAHHFLLAQLYCCLQYIHLHSSCYDLIHYSIKVLLSDSKIISGATRVDILKKG